MTLLEKSGLYISGVIVIILLLLIIFARNGVIDYNELKNKENQVVTQSAVTNEKNHVLENEIKKLKTDTEYIKHVAKHEYEMAEKDEMIFKEKDTQ